MGDSSGDANRADGETPLHELAMDALDIDATAVTNADFAQFVGDTGYFTEAETFEFSAELHLAIRAPREGFLGHTQEHPGGSACAEQTGSLPWARVEH
ncbi:SUMF1/EgtB/PvdO family nonheme iron enzyme [Microbacterium sp. AGC85]